jgi:hypothetical protein
MADQTVTSEMGVDSLQRLSHLVIRNLRSVAWQPDTPLRVRPKTITLSGASLSIPPIVCGPALQYIYYRCPPHQFLLFFLIPAPSPFFRHSSTTTDNLSSLFQHPPNPVPFPSHDPFFSSINPVGDRPGLFHQNVSSPLLSVGHPLTLF